MNFLFIAILVAIGLFTIGLFALYTYLKFSKGKSFFGKTLTTKDRAKKKQSYIINFIIASVLIIALPITWSSQWAERQNKQTQITSPDIFESSSFLLPWKSDDSVKGLNKDALVKVIQAFENQCLHGGLSNPKDVLNASISFQKPETYRVGTYGWEWEIVLTLQIDKNAKFKAAAGHTLVYYIGGPKGSGILTQKLEAQKFLGIAESELKQDEDFFVPFS